MSAGGFISSMITSIKNNTLAKRRENFDGSSKQYENSEKKLEFDEISDEKLEEVKAEIRKAQIKERRKYFIISLTILAIICSALYWGLYNTNDYFEDRHREREARIAELSSPKLAETTKEEFISLADKHFESGNYLKAKENYTKALMLDKNDKDVKISLTHAFVLDCIHNDNLCIEARKRVKVLSKVYPGVDDFDELEDLLRKAGKY